MNWKLFIAAFASSCLLCTPQNIIGCGPDADPYDYYTSFFSQRLQNDQSYRPFYYTGYRFLFDEEEPVSTKETTSAEWIGYTSNKTTKKDVQQFVLKYSHKQLSNLYNHLEKKQPLVLPDSVKQNSFTKWFLQTKDLEALGYLMYAKQVEPFVIGDEDMWEERDRDDVKMKRLIKNGIQLWTAAKQPFIQLRYGYQVTRLAHYSEQNKECVSYYDTYVKPNQTKSVLQELSLGLKAGAMYRLGNQEEAAYIFSQLCASNAVKRKSNYLSFTFSTRDEEGTKKITKDAVLRYCKTNQEKANVTAVYAFNSLVNNLPVLKEIYQLDPASPLLELLSIREINKLEEKYLHPSIQQLKGKKLIYSWNLFSWDYENANYDSLYNESEQQTKAMIGFYHQLAQDKRIPNRGLYEVAAAYAAYMSKDLKKAREYLRLAKDMSLSAALNDQWMLTSLLVSINEKGTLHTGFEEEILPAIEWLEGKAKKDEEWRKFYRNLFTEILAVQYSKQNDASRTALVLGCADRILYETEEQYGYWSGNAMAFLRTQMNSKEVEALYALMQSNKQSKFEQYLIAHNQFSKDDVSDIAGTSYLRERDWNNAERWLKQLPVSYYQKEPYNTYLAANPFADLLYDTHAPTDQDTSRYTKLQYVQKMKQLTQQTTTGTAEQKAKAWFQLANGLYQSSYWGNSWMLQEYWWSSGDGLKNNLGKDQWQREYFGVFAAEQSYLKAMELTADANFKARCVFMAAKCSQKQIPVPLYESFADYDLFEKASEQYAKDITKNKYFETIVKNYRETKTYNNVFNSCVYLKDYVNGK
jgi:hypothetical protein